jgi:hypothetical protein
MRDFDVAASKRTQQCSRNGMRIDRGVARRRMRIEKIVVEITYLMPLAHQLADGPRTTIALDDSDGSTDISER